jgi:DnaA-homolog protein
MVSQLTLGVSLKDEATFANYYAGENAPLVEELKKIANGVGERYIYISGASGLGRTHLLQAICHQAYQHKLSAVYLPLNHLNDFSPEIFQGLESLKIVCIDDIHLIAGLTAWEQAFFHAYNRILDSGSKLCVTGNVIPKFLHITLPDLVSRLSWGMVFQLHALTDQEKLKVLKMRCERRGMTLSEEVGKFILNHNARHMGSLFTILDTLDGASLAAQRKLTIPFVKDILKI